MLSVWPAIRNSTMAQYVQSLPDMRKALCLVVLVLVAGCAVWLSTPQYQDNYPTENIHHYIVLHEIVIRGR